MDIKIGQCYINKTHRFLLPSLRAYGDVFVRKFIPVFKLAIGIHDNLVNGTDISKGRNIYILCDKLTNEKSFWDFLEWIKYQDYYVADYCPDSEILSSRKHMIVVKVPEVFNDAYDHFLQGNYSLMYLENEIKLMFSNPERKLEYEILTRSKERLLPYSIIVNEEFDFNKPGNIKQLPEDFINSELELPLKRHEEIFNCEPNDSVFFNEKIDKKWMN